MLEGCDEEPFHPQGEVDLDGIDDLEACFSASAGLSLALTGDSVGITETIWWN